MTVFGADYNADCEAQRQTAKRVSLYLGVLTLFNWGIIGTGFVARKFVLGLRASAGGRALAVVSRGAPSANAFATDFGITSCGDDLAALLASGVDAVYIATPPTAHRPPPTVNRSSSLLPLTSRSSSISLLPPALPMLGEIRSLLAAGAIGKIRSL